MNNDPFDIEWRTADPLGRDIFLRKSVADAREAASKHVGDEFLPRDEIRGIVEDPARIDLTQKSPRHSEIYYSDADESKPHPYARVVVRFEDDRKGEAISWSRYKEHVSLMEIVYERQGDR